MMTTRLTGSGRCLIVTVCLGMIALESRTQKPDDSPHGKGYCHGATTQDDCPQLAPKCTERSNTNDDDYVGYSDAPVRWCHSRILARLGNPVTQSSFDPG